MSSGDLVNTGGLSGHSLQVATEQAAKQQFCHLALPCSERCPVSASSCHQTTSCVQLAMCEHERNMSTTLGALEAVLPP